MNTSNFASSLRARWGVFLHLLILLVLPFAAAGPARADDCGMQNMRPCLITERKPSCDINLVESQGMCVRPACGTENARACSPFERTTMDLVLKVPAPQPCDANLKAEGGVCVRPRCGLEGGPPCTIFQRVPSCDLNLAETPAGCVHPNCGRLGQAPCGLAVKRATFGPCDVNLIPRNGQCVRPGVPGASAGAAPAQTNAAVPVSAPPAPRPATQAPPPPPPRTTALLPPPPPPPAPAPAPPTAAQPAGGIEIDTDRVGHDMHGFNVAQANPAMCQSSCTNDAQCVAWTYVKPGIQGAAPRCYLKNAVPAAARNNCCVSGTKGGASMSATR